MVNDMSRPGVERYIRRIKELATFERTALIHQASYHYETIDRGRLSYADLDGLDDETLVDLIMRAEFPGGKP